MFFLGRDESYEEEVDFFEMGVEKCVSINFFVDKVVWKLSYFYSVYMFDLKVFMVVVKVIFGFFGGGL